MKVTEQNFPISIDVTLFTGPLFSLQSPSSARNKKQIRGVGVGEEENRRYIFFILAF